MSGKAAGPHPIPEGKREISFETDQNAFCNIVPNKASFDCQLDCYCLFLEVVLVLVVVVVIFT